MFVDVTLKQKKKEDNFIDIYKKREKEKGRTYVSLHQHLQYHLE